MSNFEIIAKFGGTSVAHPERVRMHVENDGPSIVVVSAPGVDLGKGHGQKVTDMMIAIKTGTMNAEDVLGRFSKLAEDMGISNSEEAYSIVQAIPEDIDKWRRCDWPIEALGEKWTAKLYSIYLGREFADSADFISFYKDGLDLDASEELIKERINPNGLYVVPGFYGTDIFGNVRLLGRGGSDITPAILGRALEAEEVHNWSDVDGFMSCDPRYYSGAVLLRKLTYRDAAGLSEKGCQLLHPDACSILGNTAVKTIMRNTFGPIGNKGTELMASFENQQELRERLLAV